MTYYEMTGILRSIGFRLWIGPWSGTRGNINQTYKIRSRSGHIVFEGTRSEAEIFVNKLRGETK